ncbi:RNA polymerase factor sigma-54 [Neobacillus niacini]|uniref:RNA polymerase factor sigma-54 n=1 Tax=Neobacillus niacini TaxID=86668 RepID=UPI00052F5FCC|nr:RNA polymerase factor sigma-54 [Neobacillus niacini]KGM45812.1 DNA-directed RNA polymerase subunit N [Neobacillus niacini]MEC1523483.1 RNA polymerase factor sigma-54 [Neobacillus niacini]
MDLKAGLWQQQSLKLAMTQELTQAIALLQYSAQELSAFLENKALENPLLQVENKHIQPINPLIDRNRRKHTKNTENDWIEQIAAKSSSSEDQLLNQLNLRKYSSNQLKVIKHLIQNLDVNGYLTSEPEEIAEKLGVHIELVEESIIVIQTLEPAGIGARNLQECLLIQLERENLKDDLALIILSHYFVPFAEKKWKQIAKELQIPLQKIQEIFDTVQQLNPRPGALLEQDNASYIIPDAIVERFGDGYSVRLCDDILPKISFNDHYYQKLTTTKDAQVSRFLQDKVQDYQWIMKSIEQRKETLTRVVSKIVEKQTRFFEHGKEYLVPMTMKEVAGELDIHESTVSRAVKEKYVQTPIGTFPLKSFFTSTIQTVSNESTSSSQVKNEIASMVKSEDKQHPLSDQDIVEKLKTIQGIVVSRRTVAKYRDQLGIPSSSKRKRFD